MTGRLTGKRVAIYARFSSANQREASLEDQVRRCRAHAEQHGAVVDGDLVFTDAAVSGASLQRAGFEAMMVMVERRRVDAIVTEDMSRISRDIADSAMLFRRLQYLEVPLIGVSDGIDTSSDAASIAFTVKSLTAQLYLTELGDKTGRGLEGQARKGYSTGGLPFGYYSEPEPDGRGGVIGYRVCIHDEHVDVVLLMFTSYVEGMSFGGIAGMLNARGIPPPRANSKRRRQGWVASSVRSILHSEKYLGRWSFRQKEWRKLPGTNTRRYRQRFEHEVLRSEHPDRVIVDQDLWDAVQARLASVRAKYVRGGVGHKAPGHRTSYPLSGLLFCGVCKSSMTITGGSCARYYSCSARKQRRTCENALSLREDVARRCILAAIREQLTAPTAVEHLRRRIAERLGALARDANRELDERRARLDRTEGRIRGIIEFIAAGDQSDYMRAALLDLEAQAKSEKRGIESVLSRSRSPVRLPTPEAVLARALDLERVLAADPVRAREALRRLFVDGRIVLEPGEDGVYLARFTFLPLVLVAEGDAGAEGVAVPLAVRLA